jgi:hypothetical protein
MPSDYDKIKQYIVDSKPMVAKYDPPGGTPGGNGLRRFWPHVLGKSTVPGNPTAPKIPVVLCRQYHPPAFAGWKCLKVDYMSSIGDVPGPQPSTDPDMTATEKDRQSSVEDVDVWR